jgi:cell division protein ZapA (FtsZ GTPase activity inhibitor)
MYFAIISARWGTINSIGESSSPYELTEATRKVIRKIARLNSVFPKIKFEKLG